MTTYDAIYVDSLSMAMLCPMCAARHEKGLLKQVDAGLYFRDMAYYECQWCGEEFVRPPDSPHILIQLTPSDKLTYKKEE